MVVGLLLALFSSPDFQFNCNFESAIAYNEYRKSGGNEFSLGDYILNPRIEFGYDMFSLSVDYVPEESVLDFNGRENYHNENIFRADGYLARPNLLVALESEIDNFSTKLGGFKAVDNLSLSQSQFYLSRPIPHLHLTTYAIGIQAKHKTSFSQIDISVIDGDWQLGEPNLYRRWDSRANSYPSYAGNLRINYSLVYAGASGTLGDIGSNRGEKRRQSHGMGYIGIDYKYFRLQCYLAYYVRNPKDQDLGNHVPAVETWGAGIDAKFQYKDIAISTHIWRLKNYSNIEDGEVWFTESKEMWGWNVTARYDFYRSLYLSLFISQIYIETNSFLYPDITLIAGIAVGIDI